MTPKELQLSRQLGCFTYTIYSYIKTNTSFRNKEINYDIGISDQTRHRGLVDLQNHNVIRVFGKTTDREFEVINESEWKL